MMNDPQELKQAVVKQFRDLLTKRIDVAQEAIAHLRSSAAEETKSSAGDKYETAREMISQEIGKHEMQISDARSQLAILNALDFGRRDLAAIGALVETDSGFFFLSTSAPKFSVDAVDIIPVSPHSPFGKNLSGKKAGDSITVNQRSYKIISVY